ncbi:MAG: hypothetical protein HFG20_04410 [Anaerotruncus sp.]|jgi:hypothetical protein|nr:hypothetical protein [Anaerotruncus sp.]
MQLLAHRGYWRTPEQKNTLQALGHALKNGYGFESDLRDYLGKLVISHNIARADSPEAQEVFALLASYQDRFCFAINIKADGMELLLAQALKQHHLCNYFTFDQSVPQLLEYQRAGLRTFTRQSEYERQPVLYEQAAGVWLDAFFDDRWIDRKLIEGHLAAGKQVCIVSPELHGREPQPFWERLYSISAGLEGLLICTDLPDLAKKFFCQERGV